MRHCNLTRNLRPLQGCLHAEDVSLIGLQEFATPDDTSYLGLLRRQVKMSMVSRMLHTSSRNAWAPYPSLYTRAPLTVILSPSDLPTSRNFEINSTFSSPKGNHQYKITTQRWELALGIPKKHGTNQHGRLEKQLSSPYGTPLPRPRNA